MGAHKLLLELKSFPKCRFNNPQKFIMNEAEKEENQYYDDLYCGVSNYDSTMHLELKQIYHQLVMDGMIVC